MKVAYQSSYRKNITSRIGCVLGVLPWSRFTLVGETEAEQRALGAEPHSIDAATVIRFWEDGLVPLDGGGFAPLPQPWLDQHGAVLARLLAARADDGRLANHALLALGSLCDDLDQPPVADGVARAAANLRQRIRPFVMRRRKAEVAPELPPRTEAALLTREDLLALLA